MRDYVTRIASLNALLDNRMSSSLILNVIRLSQ